jgi:hypothetical protein
VNWFSSISAGFVLGFLFDPENGSDLILQAVRISPKYVHGVGNQTTVLFVVTSV